WAARCRWVGVRGGGSARSQPGVSRSAKRCSASRLVTHLQPSLSASSLTSTPPGPLTPFITQRSSVVKRVRLPLRPGGAPLHASFRGLSPITGDDGPSPPPRHLGEAQVARANPSRSVAG